MIDRVEISRKKMKNIILKIKPDGRILLSVPKNLSNEYIKKFLQEKNSWIEEKLKKIEKNYIPPVRLDYVEGEFFSFLGKSYKLEIKKSKTNKIEIIDNNIILNQKENYSSEQKKILFEKWYKKRAEELFSQLMEKYQNILGLKPEELKIRKMKRIWGSCNCTKKRITLNLELIKKPVPAIEYVVLHELVHLIHPNHSKDFWNHVEIYMQDWRERKGQL